MIADTLTHDVCTLLATRLGLDPATVTPEARLVEDLGVDSLDAVEMALVLEKQYGIALPEDALERPDDGRGRGGARRDGPRRRWSAPSPPEGGLT